VTRLDTHNQPAVIEAFKAWARTLTRAYAQFAVGFSRSSRASLHRDIEEHIIIILQLFYKNNYYAYVYYIVNFQVFFNIVIFSYFNNDYINFKKISKLLVHLKSATIIIKQFSIYFYYIVQVCSKL